MRNIIIYSAFTAEEVLECSYSLLKYLDIYNLKPPPSHSLVIYTNDPASLEAYGSFFPGFELKDLYARDQGPAKLPEFIHQVSEPYQGNILYLGRAAYPVRPLDPMFEAMGRGTIFLEGFRAGNNNGRQQGEIPFQISTLGFNSSQRDKIKTGIENIPAQPAKDIIASYHDLKEFHQLLHWFFSRHQEESIPNQVKLMHSTDALDIRGQKQKFQELPAFSRLLRRLMGKGWSISNYRKKI